jgi:hypothetical protein
MLKILKILSVVAALAAGWPLGVLLVQLACTTPVFGYCGGHERSGVVYLSFWAAAALCLWLVFKALVNRWASTRLRVFHPD